MADQEQNLREDLSVEVSEPAQTPATVKKVELDLDDAPFLQAEEKSPPPVPAEEPEEQEDEADKARRKRKKLMILAGAGAILLVAIAAAVWWFFFRTPPPPPPEGPKPEVIVVPSTPANTHQPDIVREFAPFVVPVKEADGQTRFLVCKFSSIAREAAVNNEIEHQLLPLRDAIYYYLRSKDSNFLLDARNGAEIKRDLLSVFNDYLSQGKLEDIVFESYLSR